MVRYRSSSPRLRLFRSDLLERLTLISTPVFAVTWTVFLGVALHASWGVAGPAASIMLVSFGLLIWVLFEYALHRFVFHLKFRSAFGRWLIFVTHGNHHALPGDPQRNIMPPIVSVSISCMIWLTLRVLMGPEGSVVFLGFGIGYVLYDVTHYACHQLPMRGRVLSALRRHHVRHHCAAEEGNYAITAIFLDRFFGTYISSKGR